MNKNIRKAKVKADGRIIEVYKLMQGFSIADKVWNIHFGDKISIAIVEAKAHMETFSENELVFI